jgi:hypothetical protein
MNINLEQAESLVRRRRDMKWDGWTLSQTRFDNSGATRRDGVYDRRSRRWMIESRFVLQPDGTYNVPGALGHGL